MTPTLFESNETNFTTNGLGQLPELYDVDIKEQRNGVLELTGYYPVTGRHYDDIEVDRIIFAKPNTRDGEHAFRIVSSELDPINDQVVEIVADSITNDLRSNLITSVVISGQDGQSAMNALKNACEVETIFDFYSDIETKSSTELSYVNPLEAIAGTTGSILQYWGGEIKRENRRISILKRRGFDDVTTFRLGKNISGLKYTVKTDNLVTRIYPYYKKTETGTDTSDSSTSYIAGKVVDSPNIKKYPNVHIKPVDVSQQITVPQDSTDDQIKTLIDDWAKNWFTKSENTDVDLPDVTIDLDLLSLQNSTDYAATLQKLEQVGLTDSVTVFVPQFGIDVTAVINELHFDPMTETITKITAGTAKQSFADSNSSALADMQNKIIAIATQADAAALSADGKTIDYFGDEEPVGAREGDTWFYTDVNGSGIKQLQNGVWVIVVDSNLGKQIEQKIADATKDIPVLEANIETAMQLAQDNAAKFADQDASIKAINDLVTGAKTDAANALLTAQTLQSDYTGIKQDIDTINGTLATVATQATVNGLTGDVQQLQATQKTQADQIVNMVTKTDLTTATNGLATESYVSGQIKVASDQISSTVTKVQNQLDNQTLGFRNLIPNSTFKLGQQGWTGWDTTSVHIQTETYHSKTYTAVFLGHLADGVVYKDLISTAKIPLKPSTAYTIRVLTRSIISNNNFIFTQEKSADDAVINDHAWKLDLKTADYQASIQHWTTSANADHATFRVRVNPNDEFMISEIMLVEGNTLPTDHIPAPEDSATVAALTSVSQTVDAIKVMATDNQNDLTALTVKVNGWQAAVTDQINDVKNTQTSLANQWTQEISSTGSPNLISADGWYYNSAATGSLTKATHAYYTGTSQLWRLNNMGTSGVYAKSNQFAVQPGQTYTISILIFGGSNVSAAGAYVLGLKTPLANPTGQYDNPDGIVNLGGFTPNPLKAEHKTWTFKVPDGITSAFLRIDNGGTSDGERSSIFFAEAQIEHGSLATAFRPSTTVMAANIVEMQDLISANVTVAGKIAAQLSLSADGGGTALLAGNHVHITGATTIDSAVIKDSMIATMSANKITAGTIDASQVNVVNINASNITTGSITGANLSINLNTGQVEFQKGSISSADNSLDINIDEGYIALTNNYDHSILIKDGQLQFTQPNIFDPTQGEPYMSISNDVVGNALHGASLLGRDYVAMSTNENMTSSLFGTDSIMGAQTFAGFGVGKNYKTVIGGATRGVFISGGQQIKNSDALQPSPSISIGSDAQGVNSGNRIVLKGEYVHAMAVQYQTTSGSANVFVANDGALVRVTSALKYKDQVERTYDDTIAERLITLPTATWIDKAERNRYNSDPAHQPVPERHFGMIAEDLAAAGIEELVVRGLDGELEGIEYDRIGPALVPLIKRLYDRVKKLEELQNETTT